MRSLSPTATHSHSHGIADQRRSGLLASRPVNGASGSPPLEAHLHYRVQYDIGRVRGFSDCVFAVAITIVVITFVLPDRVASDAKLASDLLNEWPRYLSYLAAFAVVGYTWINHHQLFELIRRVDATAVWTNLALLSFIVLLPFPMQLLGRFRGLNLPYVLFNLDAFLFGVLNLVLVVYATRDNRLVSARFPDALGRVLRMRAAVFPVTLAIATVVAVPFGGWSTLVWIAIPGGRWVLRKRHGSLARWPRPTLMPTSMTRHSSEPSSWNRNRAEPGTPFP